MSPTYGVPLGEFMRMVGSKQISYPFIIDLNSINYGVMYAIPNKCLELRLLLHMQYNVFDVKFLVPSKFFMKVFFNTMHSMWGLGQEAKS